MQRMGIYWLASYPKSGNTWLRAFLARYRAWPQISPDLHSLLAGSGIASNRGWFDEATGLNSSELTADEIAILRPRVYRQLARSSVEPLYLKIHDARITTPIGEASIPADVSTGIIYLIRNPLAVSVSFAKHGGLSIDMMIDRMADESYALATRDPGSSLQLPQPVLSWSSHVRSWTTPSDIPLLTLRYEDMLKQPEASFAAAVRFIGWPLEPDRLAGAVERSSFRRLRELEQERGFGEVLSGERRFFRSGKSDSWRNELTPDQVSTIVKRHRAVMEEWGYSTTGLI